LLDVALEMRTGDLPAGVASLLVSAGKSLEQVCSKSGPGFVPSDFEEVYRALEAVREGGLAPGPAFCEWGSGLGVVACLAATLGFSAHGIEIDRDLVDAAREFAADHGLAVAFSCGSFLPPGCDDLADEPREFDWLLPGGDDGHAALDLDPAELDLVFAYPWPGDEQVVFDLFERVAGTGALLVTYHGIDGIRARRKQPPG